MSRVKAPIATWVRAVTVASATVGASFTAASPVEACSCRATGPACQAYWNAEAVFDATVVRVERTTRDEVLGDELLTISKRLVTLEVKQTWKGLESARVQVVTD